MKLLIILLIFGGALWSDALKRQAVEQVFNYANDETVLLREGDRPAPPYVKGRFFRQMCFSLGDDLSLEPPRIVSHFFDCIGGTAMYDLSNTNDVRFYSQPYKTGVYDVFVNRVHRKFSEYGVFYYTIGSPINETSLAEFKNETKQNTEVSPNVNYWLIGGKVMATTESDKVMQLDPHNLNSLGFYPWKAEGVDPDLKILNFPAHEAYDKAHSMTYVAYNAYKVNNAEVNFFVTINSYSADGVKRQVLSHLFSTASLTKCINASPYPEKDIPPGYMHFFSISEKYYVVHVNSFAIDPCKFTYRGWATPPSYLDYFDYLNRTIKFLLFSRADNSFVAEIDAEEDGFLIHEVNTYDEGDTLVFESTIGKSGDAYLKFPKVEELLKNADIPIHIKRFTMNPTSKKLIDSQQLINFTTEFPQINRNFFMKKTRYFWAVKDPLIDGNDTIYKYDAITDEVTMAEVIPGAYPHEPIFIPNPEGQSEDDGVVITSGAYLKTSEKRRSFLAVYQADTMRLLSFYETSESPTTVGLHNRYYENSELDLTVTTSPTTSATGTTTPAAATRTAVSEQFFVTGGLSAALLVLFAR